MPEHLDHPEGDPDGSIEPDESPELAGTELAATELAGTELAGTELAGTEVSRDEPSEDDEAWARLGLAGSASPTATRPGIPEPGVPKPDVPEPGVPKPPRMVRIATSGPAPGSKAPLGPVSESAAGTDARDQPTPRSRRPRRLGRLRRRSRTGAPRTGRLSVVLLVLALLAAGGIVDRRPAFRSATRAGATDAVVDPALDPALIPGDALAGDGSDPALTGPANGTGADASTALGVASVPDGNSGLTGLGSGTGRLDPLAGQPRAVPERALSSTLFCAGATARPGDGLNGFLAVANPTDKPMTGTVTLVPDQGTTVVVPISVGAKGRTVINVTASIQSPFIAATVQLDHGGAGAEMIVGGSAGHDVLPCTVTASDRWTFASGSTGQNDRLLLWLYNPFPDDAVADLSFATDQGAAAPGELAGIVVAGRGLRMIDVGASVRRRDAVSTFVTVRSGRVVATMAQLHGGGGVPSYDPAVWIGSPAPVATWQFPEAGRGSNSFERFALANPGDDDAAVSVEFTLDQGVVAPVDVTIPAHDRIDVDTSKVDGLAKGAGYSVTIRSQSGVPFVAERVTGGTAAPFWRVTEPGMRGGGEAWMFPIGGTADGVDEVLVVQNTSAQSVVLDIGILADGIIEPVPGLQGVTLDPGRRSSFHLDDRIKRGELPLLVIADQSILVLRTLGFPGNGGVSQTPGIFIG